MKRHHIPPDFWFFGVPVRRSNLTPLHAKDASYNIETDLARISTVAAGNRGLRHTDLLWSDFQTTMHSYDLYRHGSGRSGVYRNRYVKGLGVTPLAANWNMTWDQYHNSGHLLATGGIREYLVSLAFRAEGVDDTIVPCTGILVGPLSRYLKDMNKAFYRRGRRPIPGADANLRALTLKPSSFVRMTNFVWLLGRVFTCGELLHYLACLEKHLKNVPGVAKKKALSVEDLFSTLSTTLQRVFDHFETAFRMGFLWGSYNNNFSLDGRFLDLELALCAGSGFIGGFHPKEELTRAKFRGFHGFEILAFIEQIRYFIDHQRYELRRIRAHVLNRKDAELTDYILKCYEKVFSPKNWIYSKSFLCERMLTMYTRNLRLTRAQTNALKKVIDTYFRIGFQLDKSPSLLRNHDKNITQFPLTRHHRPFAPVEPGNFLTLFHFDHIPFSERALERARVYNELLNELDQKATVESLLEGLSSAQKTIVRTFSRNSQQRP